MTAHGRRLLNLLLAAGIAFALMACALAYWSVLRAPDLNTREDNPRQFEREVRIQRGPILASDGSVLAENGGTAARQERRYPFAAGGHVVGYASLVYGTSGIEEGFDALLRGDTLGDWGTVTRDLLHLPQVGQGVRLALDPTLQATAVQALAAQSGAVVVLELPGDCATRATCPALLRAVASAPGYDANALSARPDGTGRLEATFEALLNDPRAPLVNRALQGQYQPGMTLQPLLVAAALDQGRIRLTDPIADASRPVAINGTTVACRTPPPAAATWVDVVRHGCPGPMQALGESWGTDGLTAVFDAFGLTRAPSLRIATATTPDEPLQNAGLAAVGYDNLSITPLRLALALGTLASGGELRPPQLATAVQDTTFTWQDIPPLGITAQPLTPSSAAAVGDLVTPTALSVLSGPAGSTNGWHYALVEANGRDYVVVVVVEESDGTGASVMGTAVIEAVNRRP